MLQNIISKTKIITAAKNYIMQPNMLKNYLAHLVQNIHREHKPTIAEKPNFFDSIKALEKVNIVSGPKTVSKISSMFKAPHSHANDNDKIAANDNQLQLKFSLSKSSHEPKIALSRFQESTHSKSLMKRIADTKYWNIGSWEFTEESESGSVFDGCSVYLVRTLPTNLMKVSNSIFSESPVHSVSGDNGYIDTIVAKTEKKKMAKILQEVKKEKLCPHTKLIELWDDIKSANQSINEKQQLWIVGKNSNDMATEMEATA
jgi:hypothetical protein